MTTLTAPAVVTPHAPVVASTVEARPFPELETFAVAAADFQNAWPSVSDAFRLEMFEEFRAFHARGHSYGTAPHWWSKDAELSSLYQSIAYFVDTRTEVLEAWTYEDTQRIVHAVDLVRKQIETGAPFVWVASCSAFHLAVWAVLSGGTFEVPDTNPMYI